VVEGEVFSAMTSRATTSFVLDGDSQTVCFGVLELLRDVRGASTNKCCSLQSLGSSSV